jgi:hypothetical protein
LADLSEVPTDAVPGRGTGLLRTPAGPLGIMVRGFLVSSPGIPPHLLLESISRNIGKLCAEVIEADIGTVLKARQGFADAFAEGMRQIPTVRPRLQHPPATPQG